MNKIYFSGETELNIIKKVLLQLDRKKGYKIFLPFSKFVALTNFIMFNQFPNIYEFWIDITNNVDNITGEENCILYYDFGKNPDIKNIIKIKSILSENKTLVVKVNLNTNTKVDIMKIWNYNCDIFFDNDTYDIEKIKEIFSFWQSKRHNYNRKILDFELLLSFNLDERANTYYVNNNKLQIKNYINNSFDLNLNTIKEIENNLIEEITCNDCSLCSLYNYCKTTYNGCEGLHSFYTNELYYNCLLSQYLLESAFNMKENDERRP